MKKPAIWAAAILLVPMLGVAIAGVSQGRQGTNDAPRAGYSPAGPAIHMAQSSADQCKQACRAKYKCADIVATPGMRNPELVACKERLQVCISECK
jgi:hypothetical protein